MTGQDGDGLANGPLVSLGEPIVRLATPPLAGASLVQDGQEHPDRPSPTLNIPENTRSHRRRSRADSSAAGSPSSGRSLPSLSPDSARPRSPFDHNDIPGDGASVYSSCDRGYTAAEQHYRSESLRNPDLPDLAKPSDVNLADIPQKLERSIRDSLCPYGGDADSERRWLPVDKLLSLVNEDSVFQELSRVLIHNHHQDKLRGYAKKICESVSYKDRNGRENKSCRLSLFAILTLMGEVASVPALLETSLLDKDLPLKKQPATKLSDDKFASSANDGKRWPIGMEWADKECDLFLTYQKYMLSPFFELEGEDVPFYDLDPNTVLPFVEKTKPSKELHGHHGSVWQVKIHQAHHNMHKDGRNPYFAMKHIYSENSVDVKEEIKSWARSVGVKGHKHLINLLAFWVQGPDWYLLFRWADGNLRKYWEMHSRPERSFSVVQWIASQCEGIAQALRKIHRNDSERLGSGWDENNDVGIHSDIKPENILWFRDAQEKHGHLVICDFGFTRFHGRQSRSTADRAGGTDTYRGPEIDLTGRISRAYDIWALGCLYIEFVTWYLMGFDGVQKHFADARIKGDDKHSFGLATDKFFNCFGLRDAEICSAVIKPSVLEWIRKLRGHEDCSQYLHEFLDLIVTRLLVVNPKERKTCDFIGVKLRELREKCDLEGESYCSTGRPRVLTEDMDPVENKPFEFHGCPPLIHSTMSLPADRSIGADRTWAVDSVSSSEGQPSNQEIHSRIDVVIATRRDTHKERVANKTIRVKVPPLPSHRDLTPNEMSDEQAPLLPSRRRATTNSSSGKSNGTEADSEERNGESTGSYCCCQ